MNAKQVDGADWAVIVGVVLLGAALWLWLGWAALLGFVGAVLVVVGLVAATGMSDGGSPGRRG